MTEPAGPTRYEIELDGHASGRLLRPVIDEFSVELTETGTTRLVGIVRDSSHLSGLLGHFTSFNVDVVALRRIDRETDSPSSPFTHNSNTQGEPT